MTTCVRFRTSSMTTSTTDMKAQSGSNPSRGSPKNQAWPRDVQGCPLLDFGSFGQF